MGGQKARFRHSTSRFPLHIPRQPQLAILDLRSTAFAPRHQHQPALRRIAPPDCADLCGTSAPGEAVTFSGRFYWRLARPLAVEPHFRARVAGGVIDAAPKLCKGLLLDVGIDLWQAPRDPTHPFSTRDSYGPLVNESAGVNLPAQRQRS